ncbi:hypothetical protein BO70DRAFT_358789 [Aspergillus heteromorphus CBS 117.55]|uniref:Elongation factor 1-beta n=1 Tax=Aspergillus heteromorphus CBS 117.55 TaxID=1448321 RepID=A0A317WTN7_9EURO|nr:uncharacterized protein BO70DRAFT_358789 [Aspergillus heteromorphus CBS 117.55]PWY89764.1 hypothetical protein BO70DRAFT_358789 [Aspergillus heteromorphus CBS 117.55]
MVYSDAPSQADAVTFKAFSGVPDAEKFPHAARWYKHIASLESEFSTLPGDASKAYTAYGPESAELPTNPKDKPEDDEDDMSLFGSDEEEEDPEVVKEREARLAEYKKKKEGKAKPAAKSMVTLDVKPWDDETNLEEMEANVRAIEKDGLVWGASKFVVVGFGIKKLQINLVVEDEKVSLDELQQNIEEDEDHVQSTDVVSQDLILPSVRNVTNRFPLGRYDEAVNGLLLFNEEPRCDGLFYVFSRKYTFMNLNNQSRQGLPVAMMNTKIKIKYPFNTLSGAHVAFPS